MDTPNHEGIESVVADGAPKAGRREWIGLAVIALPCLLYSMDLTVLELAVPKLSAALKPTSSQLLWIMDVYGFLLAGFLLTMGALGDRRRTHRRFHARPARRAPGSSGVCDGPQSGALGRRLRDAHPSRRNLRTCGPRDWLRHPRRGRRPRRYPGNRHHRRQDRKSTRLNSSHANIS